MRATKRRLLVTMVIGVGVAGLLVSPAMANNEDHKISICHVPPGNPDNAHVISIDEHAWANGHTPHNAHDQDFVVDADQACPAIVPTTTTTTPEL